MWPARSALARLRYTDAQNGLVLAEGVGERIPPIAPETLARDLDARRGLPPLVFGCVEQSLHSRDGLALETAPNDLVHTLLLLDEAVEDLVERVVGWQGVL